MVWIGQRAIVAVTSVTMVYILRSMIPAKLFTRRYYGSTTTTIITTTTAWTTKCINNKRLPITTSSSLYLNNNERKMIFLPNRVPIIQRFLSSTSSETAAIGQEEDQTQQQQQQQQQQKERLSKQNLSLELRTVVDHLEIVISHLQSRNANDETIEAAKTIALLSSDRTTLIRQRDLALQKRKEYSAIVGKLMRGLNSNTLTTDEQIQLDTTKELSTKSASDAEDAESKLQIIQSTIDELIATIPNLLDDIVPYGTDDKDNYEVYKWGDVTKLPTIVKEQQQQQQLSSSSSDSDPKNQYQPKWHDEIAIGLNGYLVDAAIKMSGTRFIALSGVIAQLERAIAMFLLDYHTNTNNYTEVSVPYIVSRSSLYGTSQIPKFQNDLFAITNTSHTCNGEDAFLIPTAEVPVTNLHRDSILDEDMLPLSYVAYTPCFRAEAGSYGRDTRGLIRQHQFTKVELVKITTADTSHEQHELLTNHAEQCLQLLDLPYRKVRLCSGDIGFAAQHCYDLEVWLPGSNEYREISSCSNIGDFQARRMSLRYRPKSTTTTSTSDDKDTGTNNSKGGKIKKTSATQQTTNNKPLFCHTINGSGLAVGRTLVAILENYQMPDGSVIVPTVLRPYMGGKDILKIG